MCFTPLLFHKMLIAKQGNSMHNFQQNAQIQGYLGEEGTNPFVEVSGIVITIFSQKNQTNS